MPDKSFKPFRFLAEQIPIKLAMAMASDSTPVDCVISAMEYYKEADESTSFSARIFPSTSNIDWLNISESFQTILCERLFAAENYSRLSLLSQHLQNLQRIDSTAMTTKASRIHAKQITDAQLDAVTAHNCLVKNCAQLELECNELGAVMLAMTLDFQHETKGWIKSAGKTLDKILQNTSTAC